MRDFGYQCLCQELLSQHCGLYLILVLAEFSSSYNNRILSFLNALINRPIVTSIASACS